MEVGFKLIGGAMAPAAPGLGIPEKKNEQKMTKITNTGYSWTILNQ